MRKTAFVKVSGDMLESRMVLDWLRILAESHYVVICTGGGTQINQAFEQAGFPVRKHGPLGREHASFDERQLARNVLETNQAQLQDQLAAEHIAAVVVIPVLDIGGVLCHVNGDTYLLASYLGFDALHVVTTSDRLESKAASFAQYPKIRVHAF
jgi:acetylglutamate kinase